MGEKGRCAARVQRVQMVQKVQRVVVSPLRGDDYEVCVTGTAFPPPTVILSESEGSRFMPLVSHLQ